MITQERLEYFKNLVASLHLYSRDWIVELINELEQLQSENANLQAELTRWQDRARLYHNHIVMLQQDREAIIQ